MEKFEFGTTVMVVFQEGPNQPFECDKVFDVVKHSVQKNLEILRINKSVCVLCRLFDQWWLLERDREPKKVKSVARFINIHDD